MIHIAICDDDANIVEGHKKTVEECLSKQQSAGQITTYTSSDNLLYDIEEDNMHYDLLLLDIEMPGFTGMEVAEKIRPYLPNAKVIFITTHIEFAIDAFELFVFRYVPKQQMEQRLPAAVSDAIKLLDLEEGKSYTIQTNSRLEKIPYKDILYITKEGKNAEITASSGVSKVRKSLGQVFEELDAEEFIFIDRGCIVNMIHVMQIKDGTAVLKNGESLAISRSNLQTVKEQINAYWGAHI